MIVRIFSTGLLFMVILFGLMQCFRNNDIQHISHLVEYPGIFFHSIFEFGGKGEFTPYELSMFFTIFVFFQIWNLFNAKAFESGHTAFYNVKDSKVFFAVVIGIFIGQYAIVMLGGQMFSVVPLAWIDWAYIVVLTSVIMVVPLILKIFKVYELKR